MFSLRFIILICLLICLPSQVTFSQSTVFLEFKIGEAVIYFSMKIMGDMFMSALESAIGLFICLQTSDLH